MMKKSANWMIEEDDRILEYLDREGAASAWQVAHDLHLRTGTVRDRLRVLAEAGWVAYLPRDGRDDHYTITGWGRGYLRGHIDANTIRPIPGFRPSYAMRPDWWAGFG